MRQPEPRESSSVALPQPNSVKSETSSETSVKRKEEVMCVVGLMLFSVGKILSEDSPDSSALLLCGQPLPPGKPYYISPDP